MRKHLLLCCCICFLVVPAVAMAAHVAPEAFFSEPASVRSLSLMTVKEGKRNGVAGLLKAVNENMKIAQNPGDDDIPEANAQLAWFYTLEVVTMAMEPSHFPGKIGGPHCSDRQHRFLS